ncbi:MAG: hypothetical protein RR052_03685 [Oscillospiraceae bacterium]
MTKKKVFFISLFLTLGAILPIFVGAMVQRLANPIKVSETKTDIPILQPSKGDYKNILLATDGENKAFILFRLDAVQGVINGAVIPQNTVLLCNGTAKTLGTIQDETGPAEVANSLAETFKMRVDNYFEISAESLSKTANLLGSIHVNMSEFSGITDPTLLKKFAFNGGEGDIFASSACTLLSQIENDDIKKAALRAKVYTSFLHTESGTEDFLVELLNSKTAVSNIQPDEKESYKRIFNFLCKNPDLKININAIPAIENGNTISLCEESQNYVLQYLM